MTVGRRAMSYSCGWPARLIQKVRNPKPAAPANDETLGLTDLDEEERAAALEEFQAVSDRTLESGREEMPIYWRMLSWVKNQSYAEMASRSNKKVTLNDFMLSPEVWRGELTTIELNIRQVIARPAPENSIGVKTAS